MHVKSLQKHLNICYKYGPIHVSVSQVCNEDGMEFTLRTPEGFYGRIYTYGFYDRCFFRGNGGTANVLRISGAQVRLDVIFPDLTFKTDFRDIPSAAPNDMEIL